MNKANGKENTYKNESNILFVNPNLTCRGIHQGPHEKEPKDPFFKIGQCLNKSSIEISAVITELGESNMSKDQGTQYLTARLGDVGVYEFKSCLICKMKRKENMNGNK